MALRILIVEDEYLLAFDVQCTLEQSGHHVAGLAADSLSARRLAQQEAVDVALVDLNLKDGATGAELGRTLAADGIAVIYLTANGNDLPDGLNGAVALVDKPCDGQRLASALHLADPSNRPPSRSPAAPAHTRRTPRRKAA